MKPDREIIVLLLFSLVCSCLLAAIYINLLKTRNELANDSPVALNSILQANRNFGELKRSLSHYLQTTDHGKPIESAVEEYRTRLEVAWSLTTIFDVRNPGETTSMPEVPGFIDNVETFLNEAEQLTHASTPLSRENAIKLINRIFDITDSIHDIGHIYYLNSNKWRDGLNERMTKLYRAISVFGLLLLASSYFLICRLYFANRKSSALIEESRQNQKELSRLVSELRSGKLERKAKDSFIAAASHDLRQPLHALGLFLGSLEKHVKPDGLATLEKAHQSNTALNHLLSSVLDLSKLDAGIVTVEATDFPIDKLTEILIKEYTAKAEERNIKLSFDTSHTSVCTDRVLLMRILRNLLDNAITHSNGTLVSVRLQQLPKQLRVTIEDNGTGIPASEHQEIFSEYYQIGNPERDRTHGLGLGLSIVKRLTDLLDIPLEFISTEGTGSSFSLTIPLGQSNQSIATTNKETGQHIHTVRRKRPVRMVAVIDDQQDICLGMKTVLDAYNYRVVSSESAKQMINLLNQQQQIPDAIVSDYRLRNHELGDAAVQEIRRALNTQVPALIVTGDTSPKRVLEASQSGLTLLHKPVTPDHLVQALDALFASSSVEFPVPART